MSTQPSRQISRGCRRISWPQVNAVTRARANLIPSRFGSAPCTHNSRTINTLWRATLRPSDVILPVVFMNKEEEV
jgi:hypothetical protein